MTKNRNIWEELPRPIKVLAPMEDVTDTAFRRIIGRCGKPDLYFSEFTSVEGLMSAGREHVIHRLEFTELERPIIAQIWGLKPEKYEEAAKLIAELGFDGIDINMGCPVPKIVKGGACSALIDNPDLAVEIIKATQQGASGLPVSVKTRLGFKTRKLESWFDTLLNQNLQAITVHARLAKDMSEKPARWEEITHVVNMRNQMGCKTIIIGNGDLQDLKDLETRVAATGADGGMVGRAALFNPFFFSDKNIHIKDVSAHHKVDLLKQHLELVSERWGSSASLGVMKKFSGVYLVNFQGASAIRQHIMELRTLGETLEYLERLDLGESEPAIVANT
jgi:nifR3 family TIM-barrel protein